MSSQLQWESGTAADIHDQVLIVPEVLDLHSGCQCNIEKIRDSQNKIGTILTISDLLINRSRIYINYFINNNMILINNLKQTSEKNVALGRAQPSPLTV